MVAHLRAGVVLDARSRGRSVRGATMFADRAFLSGGLGMACKVGCEEVDTSVLRKLRVSPCSSNWRHLKLPTENGAGGMLARDR